MQRSNPVTLIVKAAPLGGFMSNFNRVVNHLDRSLGRKGVEAVRVDWTAPGGHVRDRNFSYGTSESGNLWEEFFEPLAFPWFPAETRATSDFADHTMTNQAAYLHVYKLGGHRRQRYHELYRRHIRVRPDILARVEAWHASELGGRPAIGVHYRNQQHSCECPEPIPDVSVFVRRTEALLRKEQGGKVFLATDVEEAVERFSRAFGDRVVVQRTATRAQRANDEQIHHEHSAPSVGMGIEVLIDCLMLARCHTMLHVTSNVATAASYMNPQLKLVYVERSPLRGLSFYFLRKGRCELLDVVRPLRRLLRKGRRKLRDAVRPLRRR